MLFKSKTKNSFEGGGIILFENVESALKAERVLKKESCETKLVAPPPALRKGCDLALEINIMEAAGIERALKSRGAEFMEIHPLNGSGALLEIVKITDFGDAIMVKAANMKLTFEKGTGRVLNISGGGCPDIPYLHAMMADRQLRDLPRPRDVGRTLCALMLDRAYVESLEIWKNINC
jgi:hypothetical protein